MVVYDGGVHESVDHLDLQVFSAVGDSLAVNPATYRGKLGDVALPILCAPCPTIDRDRPRDVLAGFIGARTHVMRETLWSALENEPGFVLGRSDIYPNMAFKEMDEAAWKLVNYERFKDLMERSVFALCPRGSSTTSFRVCEALQYGCVPVYISDKFWFPYSDPTNPADHGVYDDIGITCTPEQIPELPDRLRSMPRQQIDEYLSHGQQLYQPYFTMEGCARRIIEEVNGI